MLGRNDNEIVIALPDALIKTVKEIAGRVVSLFFKALILPL